MRSSFARKPTVSYGIRCVGVQFLVYCIVDTEAVGGGQVDNETPFVGPILFGNNPEGTDLYPLEASLSLWYDALDTTQALLPVKVILNHLPVVVDRLQISGCKLPCE